LETTVPGNQLARAAFPSRLPRSCLSAPGPELVTEIRSGEWLKLGRLLPVCFEEPSLPLLPLAAIALKWQLSTYVRAPVQISICDLAAATALRDIEGRLSAA
jgi:hypothetical protein